MNIAPERQAVAVAGKYLTLLLDREVYGIAVLKVREIIRHQQITPVPQTPDSIRGIINLRGRVIPVVDLRSKFGLPAGISERTCIVVAQVQSSSGQSALLGLIVDAVEEVANLTAAEIEPAPEFGSAIDTSCLLGIAKLKGRVAMLLNIERVVAFDALATGSAAVSHHPEPALRP